MKDFAIIITAFNRIEAYYNLLKNLSLVEIENNEEVDLILSLEYGAHSKVVSMSKDYVWKHGAKYVNQAKEKLGLVKHFISTGDYTENYKYVIFLEDDLIVSPSLFKVAKEICYYYENCDGVAAASLHCPIFVESTGTRFYPVNDGYDVFFMQQPYWGKIWFNKKWKKFKEYLNTYSVINRNLPKNVRQWNESFKKIYIQYLVENNLYVVCLRESVATPFGWGGLHFKSNLYCFQSGLMLKLKKLNLVTLNDSMSIYDSHFEILSSVLKKFNPKLSAYDFDVNLLGTKEKIREDYVLVDEAKVKKAELFFTNVTKPAELGIILDLRAKHGIALVKTISFKSKKFSKYSRRIIDLEKNSLLGNKFKTILGPFLLISVILSHITKVTKLSRSE